MRQLIFTLALMQISLLSFSQDSLTLVIKLEGFKKVEDLRFNDGEKSYSFTQGKTEYTVKRLFTAPRKLRIIKGRRSTGFWAQSGLVEVTVSNKGFPNSTQVTGSPTHDVFVKLDQAKDLDEFVAIFRKHKSNPAALDRMRWRYEKIPLETLKEIYDESTADEKNLMRLIRARLNATDIPTVKKTKRIYDFIATDSAGNSFNTEDFRGKYLLLDFAETGCGYCWLEYPEMAKVLPKYQNLQVLTINEDYEVDVWRKLAAQDNITLPWPVLWNAVNKEEIFRIYEIVGWPTYYLFSPDGKLLDSWATSRMGRMQSSLDKHVK